MNINEIKCPECDKAFRIAAIISHLKDQHPENAWHHWSFIQRSLNESQQQTRIQEQERKKKRELERSQPPFRGPGTVLLESKRGTHVDEGYCSECGNWRSSLGRYSKSNYGPVLICDGCKSTIFERVGRIGSDLLFSAYEGGSFSPK